MENNNPLFPRPHSRQITLRSGRAHSELSSLEEFVDPYLETGYRPEESHGLLDYWRLLVRHKFAIASASLGGLVLGFLIGIPMKPVFRASTTLEVLNVNEDFMNMKLTQAAVPGSDSDSLSEEETQSTLLQSSVLLDRVYA